jgi:hypothetical protein
MPLNFEVLSGKLTLDISAWANALKIADQALPGGICPHGCLLLGGERRCLPTRQGAKENPRGRLPWATPFGLARHVRADAEFATAEAHTYNRAIGWSPAPAALGGPRIRPRCGDRLPTFPAPREAGPMPDERQCIMSEALPDDLAAALKCARNLLECVQNVRNVGGLAIVAGMVPALGTLRIELPRLPLALASTKSAVTPLLPELASASGDVVTFGMYAEPSAFDVLLEIARDTQSSASLASDQPTTDDGCKRVYETIAPLGVIGPAEWNILRAKLVREALVAASRRADVKQPARPAAGEPDAAPTSEKIIKRRKRSTERGEGRVKLIAALTKHHNYADGGCLNPEPVGNNVLAREADVDPATASVFFKKEFGGHDKYKVKCRDLATLILSLKLLNGEFSPHDLYGRRPPGENDRDDE